MHVIHTRSPSKAGVQLATVLVLLVEGPERVEDGPAALVEHGLLDYLIGLKEQRLWGGEAESLRGFEVDH